MSGAGASERFSAMFDELSPRVYAYARRHTDPSVAQDVVADTFLVAWRRWSDVPAEPLPWLLVVARNTMANHRRGLLRQHRLAGSVARVEELAGPARGRGPNGARTRCAAAQPRPALRRRARSSRSRRHVNRNWISANGDTLSIRTGSQLPAIPEGCQPG